MVASVWTLLGQNIASEMPATRLPRWSALRRSWLDWVTREGMRGAETNLLAEAGLHRTETGRIVPLRYR